MPSWTVMKPTCGRCIRQKKNKRYSSAPQQHSPQHNINQTNWWKQHIPFLDALITENITGGFHHSIFREPTHTNKYLYPISDQHKTQVNGVLRTFIYRSRLLRDKQNKNSIQHHIDSRTQEKWLHPETHAQSSQKHTTYQRREPKSNYCYIHERETDRINKLWRNRHQDTTTKPLKDTKYPEPNARGRT